MRWKSRLTAFAICFVIGLTAAFIVAAACYGQDIINRN